MGSPQEDPGRGNLMRKGAFNVRLNVNAWSVDPLVHFNVCTLCV